MRIVVSCEENMNCVTFERKVQDPWNLLNQLAEQVPEILDKPIKFTRKIPENNCSSYVCWEAGNTKAKKTTDIKKAVGFLRPKRPSRTLGELLQKYATSK